MKLDMMVQKTNLKCGKIEFLSLQKIFTKKKSLFIAPNVRATENLGFNFSSHFQIKLYTELLSRLFPH